MELKPLYYLVDKDNKYIPFWDAIKLSRPLVLCYGILTLLIWYLLYRNHYFTSQLSVLVGFMSNIILLSFYYIINSYAIFDFDVDLDTTSKKWMMVTSTVGDQITTLDNIPINKEHEGLLVTKDFYDNYKKKHDMVDITKFYENVCINCKYGKAKYIEGLDKLFSMRSSDWSLQGYAIITLLFTICALVFNVSKTIFNKTIIPLIKYIAFGGIVIALLWFTLYNNKLFSVIASIKTFGLLTSTSIVVAILTEIISVFNKK